MLIVEGCVGGVVGGRGLKGGRLGLKGGLKGGRPAGGLKVGRPAGGLKVGRPAGGLKVGGGLEGLPPPKSEEQTMLPFWSLHVAPSVPTIPWGTRREAGHQTLKNISELVTSVAYRHLKVPALP